MFPVQSDITLKLVLYLIGVFVIVFVFLTWSHKSWTKHHGYRFSNWSVALLALFCVNFYFYIYERINHTTFYIMTYGSDNYRSMASWLFFATTLYAAILAFCIVGRGFWKLMEGEITPFMYKLIMFIEERKKEFHL